MEREGREERREERREKREEGQRKREENREKGERKGESCAAREARKPSIAHLLDWANSCLF
jgi:hypothetical protein